MLSRITVIVIALLINLEFSLAPTASEFCTANDRYQTSGLLTDRLPYSRRAHPGLISKPFFFSFFLFFFVVLKFVRVAPVASLPQMLLVESHRMRVGACASVGAECEANGNFMLIS